jgi:ankyrin repeat protein
MMRRWHVASFVVAVVAVAAATANGQTVGQASPLRQGSGGQARSTAAEPSRSTAPAKPATKATGKPTTKATAKRDDVNRPDDAGSTPLQWAVYKENVAEVKRLLRAGADVSVANKYGATPMSLAAEIGNADIIAMLLEAGAKADAATTDGQTPLLAVARTGNVKAAQVLLSAGATVDARELWGGQTPLMWAAARRHPEMMELLIAKGADVNARSIDRDYQRHVTAEGRPKSLDSGGFTPLLYAARENCTACVDVLLKNHADIDLADPDGVSPLLVAIMNANWDLAKQLIVAGADINHWDMYGETPLFTVIDSYKKVDGGRASIDPLNTTKGVDILNLLLDRGANPNVQLFFKPANARGKTDTRGETPLIRAANAGDMDVVKLLMAHGADATLYTADRQTPIHAAIVGRAPEAQVGEMIRMFQKAGTDVNVVALVNHPEEIRGGSALHYAVRKRQKETIKLLASLGIDMNAVDQDGLTALDYTQSRGFMPFMALQTPVYKDEAALLQQLGATKMMAKNPEWPVLGPPQGIWDDIWPLGETAVHDPVYKPVLAQTP